MNVYQTSLYNDLMNLVQANEAFFFVDQEQYNKKFRIFNYRLASYTDWLLPNALNCRGTMFEIEGNEYDAIPVRLASLPFEKFFNIYENPLTMDLDLDTIGCIEVKADGSLISSYTVGDHKAEIAVLKSKGSLTSDQAIAANHWMVDHGPFGFYAEVTSLSFQGYTVILEWTSPENRIVLSYEKPALVVLGIRNNQDGTYLDRDELTIEYPNIYNSWVERVAVTDPIEFIQSVAGMTGIEGFVCRLDSGQRFKIKCDWYQSLHRTKDNINSPRRLFEAVLDQATDDMKSLFHDDPVAIETIEQMEGFVQEKYNHMVDTVERFHQRNKDLERKKYAILGQQELDRMYFGLAMSKYLGKNVDYKAFLKGKWKALGLKDREEVE